MDFASGLDRDYYIGLKALVNSNQGLFKSAKQSKFWFGKLKENSERTPEEVKYRFGVDVQEGEVIMMVNGLTKWADYGSRSLIPFIIVFVMDENGITRMYRVGGNGNLRDGWTPNPEKCKELWVRPAGLELPKYGEEIKAMEVAAKVAAAKSEWIGGVQEKVEVEAKVVRVKDLGYSRFGAMILSVLEDTAGNIINVWKFLAEPGKTVVLKGTVKDLGEFRGAKQTTLTRVKVVKVA